MMVLAVMFLLPFAVMAGSLDPSAPPDNGTMHSLEDIYKKLEALDVKIDPAPVPWEPCEHAPVAKTGQTTSYASGDDGDLQKGVTWPNPRFTDNGDGTVTDNLTGLIWLKDADALGRNIWTDALTRVAELNSGTDFSAAEYTVGTYTDWRFPNLFELESLRDMAYYGPCISNTAGTGKWTPGDPFVDVQSYYYWSGTSFANNTVYAWYVYMDFGSVSFNDKSNSIYVWPVRGGND